MTETSATSLLQLLKEEFGEEWREGEEDEVFCDGEHADGVPSIRVDSSWSSMFIVEWELGWYEQKGDAGTAEGVVLLIRAMNAASRALEKVLSDGAD